MAGRIVQFSLHHPWKVVVSVLLLSLFFGLQIPKIVTDTDPKHMLPASSPVRVYNDQMEQRFGLRPDMLLLGVSNPDGIFHPSTLSVVQEVTERIKKIPGVAAGGVTSLSTVNDVRVEGGSIAVSPLLEAQGRSVKDPQRVREALLSNPIYTERLYSRDEKTTAIYIPLEPGANGKKIAEEIRKVAGSLKGREEFHLAGDPVARDTFGAVMFQQMALFSPLAGMVMFVALLLMFRDPWIVICNMGVAMVSVIWSMGALIGLKIPVHIMSSMIPVFLMAISTDSVHIFNEFVFRIREMQSLDSLEARREAVARTLEAVARPILYTDLTTAAGFASLAAGSIIPVRIFGISVAFGTLVILLLSFTLIPAFLILLPESSLKKLAGSGVGGLDACVHRGGTTDASGGERLPEGESAGWGRTSRFLASLARLSIQHRFPVLVAGILMVVISFVGIGKIRVNNNMVEWFRPESSIRRADSFLNQKLGGTSTGYLVIQGEKDGIMADPAVLRFIEEMENELARLPHVGNLLSVADYVKSMNRVMHQNRAEFWRIPSSREEAAQYLLLFQMAARPVDVNNVIDYPYRHANIMVQLKTWDAEAMREVKRFAEKYLQEHPVPGVRAVKPAGIAYFNLIWNDEVLLGMLEGFLLSLVLVYFLMSLNFRSLLWGGVSFLPLGFTIVLIYGGIGFIGKDFDMPISVLSTLSLGLATDFAIHFIGRYRQRKREAAVIDSLIWTGGRPGKGIIRNAVLFAGGFSTMIFADLTPYVTVGIFMVLIMLLSALSALTLLPAILSFQREGGTGR